MSGAASQIMSRVVRLSGCPIPSSHPAAVPASRQGLPVDPAMKTRIALAQINVTVGDFAGSVAKVVAAARAAHNDGAKLLIAPELALSGYPPEDLLLRPAFYTASAAALADLAAQLEPFAGLHVVVGPPLREASNPVSTPAAPAAHTTAHGHGNANAPIQRGVPPVDTFNAASLIVGG